MAAKYEKKQFMTRIEIIRGFLESAKKKYDLGLEEIEEQLIVYESEQINWLHQSQYRTIIDGINHQCPVTIYDWIDIGIDTLKSDPLYRYLWKIILAAKFIERLTELSEISDNNFRMMILEDSDYNSAHIRIDSDTSAIKDSAGQAQFFLTGCILSFFNVRKISVDFKIVYQHTHLLNILRRFYRRYSFRVDETDSEILVDGVVVAKKNTLFKQDGEKFPVTMVVKELIRDDLVLLKKGELYDAPYTKIKLRWEPERSLFRVINLILGVFSLKRINKIISDQILSFSKLSSRQLELFSNYRSYDREKTVKIDEHSLSIDSLTARQREVFNLLLEGKSLKEIGDSLFISLSTVKRHTENIYNKLGVHNRYKLIAAFSEKNDQVSG